MQIHCPGHSSVRPDSAHHPCPDCRCHQRRAGEANPGASAFHENFFLRHYFRKADFLHVLYPASDSYLHTLVQPCVFIRRRYPRRYDEAVPFLYHHRLCGRQHRNLLFHPVQADGDVNGCNLSHHVFAGPGKCDTGYIHNDRQYNGPVTLVFPSYCTSTLQLG